MAPSAVTASPDHRVLLVRLPCNPIFPIGPVYLADHIHKQFPELPQRLLDLAAVPVLDVERVLLATIDAFRPTLLVFSWRDIQIYAPVDGRGGNPLQNSFEVFYARNPLKRLLTALAYRIGATAAAGALAIPIEPIPGIDAMYDIAVPALLFWYWFTFFRDTFFRANLVALRTS